MTTQLLIDPSGPPGPCSDIGRSWLRSRLAGVRPDRTLHDAPRSEVNADHPLLDAARPVLRDLESRIRGSGYHLALVDRTGQLVYRWFEDASTAQQMDEVGVLPGTSFLESALGTNAMGTALELRKPITVNGAEHYVEVLQPFSCYGRPIFHPLTRRIEGVLDISARGSEAHPGFSAMSGRVVEDIEERLLLGTRSVQRRLFDAFEVASRRTDGALMAVGDDTVIANRAAWDLIEPDDLAELREVAARATKTDATSTVRLSGGGTLQVRMQRVTAVVQGALFHLCAPTGSDASTPTGTTALPHPPTQARTGTDLVLVSGPPGSGRSTLLRTLCAGTPVTGLHATTALLDGSSTWAQTFMRAWRRAAGSLWIEEIDLLPDPLLGVVLDALTDGGGTGLALTSGPRAGLTGRAAALAARCRHIELAPLTKRTAELPTLAQRALHDLNPNASVRLTPSVVEALRSQPWPGNLHELKAVMAHVAARRSTGDVIMTDLPPDYRTRGPQKPLNTLEQAERDVIRRELVQHSGNKSRTAKALGISRTTLYARMRALRVTGF